MSGLTRLGPRLLLGAVFLSIATHSSFAADSPQYGPVPDWVQPLSAPSPTSSETTPLNVLLQDQQIQFSAANEEIFSESVVRIQSPQGLQALGTLQLMWKPDTDVLTVHRLLIHRGDQTIDLLAGGSKFIVLRRENNLELSALDGILTAALQPPDLRVGDIVDLAYSITRSDPVLAGTGEAVLGGWVQFPIARAHLRARWPDSLAVRWQASDGLKPAEQHGGGFSELNLEADNVQPPAQPTGAPLRFVVRRQVELTTFKSWSDIAGRLTPLYDKASTLSAGSPLKAEINRIETSAHSPSERAVAALQLVENSVRYVYLGMNDANLVPADADTTWSRRFGDCKAKTVLLLALLHGLGIPAEAVAVSTAGGDGMDVRLPRVAEFNHVLVRAHIDGKTYWLDGTRTGDVSLANLRTPYYHWGLPLQSRGSALVAMQPEPLAQPDNTADITIDARTGIYAPAPFHVTATLVGDAAIVLNNQLSTLTGEALDRGLRAFWSKRYDFVEVKSVAARYDAQSVTETMTMDGTATLEWRDNDYQTDGLGVGYEANFARPAGADSSAPYAVAFPTYARDSETVMLPPNQMPFSIVGANVDQTVAGIAYTRHASMDSATGVFTAEASSRTLQPEFPAAVANSAQQTLRMLSKDTLYLRAPGNYRYTDQDVKANATRTLGSAGEYVDRAARLLEQKKYDAAIEDCNRALALDAKADMALADRGIAYFWLNNSTQAIADWNAAEALNPRNYVIFGGRGALAMKNGKYDEAVQNLTKALQLSPDNRFDLWWRAHAYAGDGKPDDAIADVSRLISLGPDVEEYQYRGALYLRKSDVDAAAGDAKAITQLSGAGWQNYMAAAVLYAEAGKTSEAVQASTQAINLQPTIITYLGRARVRPVEDLVGREQDVDAALALDPHSISALGFKARMLYIAGKYADSAQWSSNALSVKPTMGLLGLRGAAYAKSGDSAKAQSDISAAYKLANGDAGSLNEFCWEMATLDAALDRALAACEEAIAKRPGVAAYLDSRGFVLLRMGRYNDSIAAYDAALALDHDEAMSLYGRGVAKLRTGDPNGAKADMRAALQLNADVADAFASYGLKP